MSVATELSRTTDLRTFRQALRAERARVAHWRRLVDASLDLAIAAAATPEPLGDDLRLVERDTSVRAPRRSVLVRAMRWGLPASEVHRLPELRELREELATYARFLDESLAARTAELVEILASDPAATLVGLPHTADPRRCGRLSPDSDG